MRYSLKYTLLTWALALSAATATTINVPADYATIQAALTAANSSDTVLVQPGTYYENIFWPDVNGIKLISAGDSSNTIIDGSGNGSVIYMNPSTATIDGTTEIRGFKIANGGNITNGGGMFVSNASPVLTRLWVTGNTATDDGGGLYISGCSLTLTDVTVAGNTASSGGGLYINDSSPTLTNVTVSGNTANYGGGLYIYECSPTLTYVTVTGNTANSLGGGLLISGSPTLTHVTVSGNTAGSSGGGLSIYYSSPTLTDVTVSGNSALYDGGGLYITYYSSPTLTYVTVTGNTANRGGGLYILHSDPKLTDVTVTGNTATSSGGGLSISYNSSPTLTDVTVTGNTATSSGGGLYISGGPSLTDVTVTGNTANYGGGLHIAHLSSPTLTDVTVTGNTANYGGGLYISSTINPTLTDIIVSGNRAYINGGGLLIGESSPTLTRVTVSRNIGEGLYFKGGSGALVNVTITGNTGGIYVRSGTPTIAGSNIAYHGAGLYNADNTNTIDADSVWWGDPSGPYHPQDNPGGLGDSVNAFVDIIQFLTEPDTAAPPIPIQNLVVTSQEDDMIQLAWEASPLGDLAGYKIYLNTDSTGFPYANTMDVGNTTSFALTNLKRGLTYYIVTTCYDTYRNESWYSKEVSAIPQNTIAPAAPQNLTVVAANERATLTWNQNTETDFLHYRIFGSPTPNPTSQIDSTTGIADTSKIIIGLTNGATYYFRVTAVDVALNESDFSNDVSATPAALAVEESSGIPASFALHPAYPNPFNPSTTIRFDLPEAVDISIVVYDLMGREVVRLVDGDMTAGYHQVIWDGRTASGREVPTGIYIARLITPQYTKSIKLLLLK